MWTTQFAVIFFCAILEADTLIVHSKSVYPHERINDKREVFAVKKLGLLVALAVVFLMVFFQTETSASNGQIMISPVSGTVTQEFNSGHLGIDVKAAQGTSVYAVSDGVIRDIRTGSFPGDTGAYGAGNYVVIQHKPGDSNQYRRYCPSEDWTVYCHLNTVNVSAGSTVRRGQLLGGIGNTGYAFGYHLHFEIREGSRYGTYINPREYIRFGYSSITGKGDLW